MFQVIGTLVPLIVSLTFIILLPIGIILGIVFFVKAKGEIEPQRKSKDKKIAWWSLCTPILIVVFVNIIWGFVVFLRSALGY